MMNEKKQPCKRKIYMYKTGDDILERKKCTKKETNKKKERETGRRESKGQKVCFTVCLFVFLIINIDEAKS